MRSQTALATTDEEGPPAALAALTALRGVRPRPPRGPLKPLDAVVAHPLAEEQAVVLVQLQRAPVEALGLAQKVYHGMTRRRRPAVGVRETARRERSHGVMACHSGRRAARHTGRREAREGHRNQKKWGIARRE